MAEHTPIPWTIIDRDRNGTYYIGSVADALRGSYVAITVQNIQLGYSGQMNAQFIVLACNHHKELVEICEEVLEGYETAFKRYRSDYKIPLHQKIEALLKKIKSGSDNKPSEDAVAGQ